MSKLFDSVSKTAGQVGDATKGIFGNKDAAQSALDAVNTVAKERGPIRAAASNAAGFGFRVASKPFRMVFDGVVGVAKLPFKAADSIGAKAVSGYGNMFAKNPKTVLIGTAAVAAVGVGHIMNKRAERTAQADLAQLQMAQQQMPMAQANTITPADYAAMEARMRQGGQNGGFAAGIQAERAAQNVQGPAV